MGTLVLQNSIIANHANGDCGNWPSFASTTDLGYNIDEDGTCISASTSKSRDPLLDKLQTSGGSSATHALLPGSPAINAGNPAGCSGNIELLNTDQRGFSRFGRCDIGAYEMQAIGFSTKAAAHDSVFPGYPITYTISLKNDGGDDIENVHITDTLPITVAFVSNSITATVGSYGYTSSVITWTGTVSAGKRVDITFQAVADKSMLEGIIVNSAIISDGNEFVTRTASVEVRQKVYLPVVLHH